jgi:methionine synthase I (cobalamin-dependent)
MTDEFQGVPLIRDAADDWRAARRETDAYLDASTGPITQEWGQRLADLLEAERALEEQYKAIIGGGMTGGTFPTSLR